MRYSIVSRARALAALVVVLSTAPHDAESQTAPRSEGPLRVGDYVRVKTASRAAPPITGRVDSLDARSIWIVPDGRDISPVEVRRDDLGRIEVRTSWDSQKYGRERGGLIGGAVGLVVGVLGANTVESCSGAWCLEGVEVATWVVGGAVVGAAVGVAIGQVVAGDGWSVIETPDLRVHVANGIEVRWSPGGGSR